VAVKLAVVMALLGALALAAGVALIYLPAGVIVAGIELIAGAYVVGYLEARHEAA
jgi:hypothetical protein